MMSAVLTRKAIPIAFERRDGERFLFRVPSAGHKPLDVCYFQDDLVRWFGNRPGRMPEFEQDDNGDCCFVVMGFFEMLTFQSAFRVEGLTPERLQ